MAPEDVQASKPRSLSPFGQELDETSLERQQQLKAESAELAEDCRFQEAMEKLTEAIALGCASALMYGRPWMIWIAFPWLCKAW